VRETVTKCSVSVHTANCPHTVELTEVASPLSPSGDTTHPCDATLAALNANRNDSDNANVNFIASATASVDNNINGNV
jgi:hypothetical protein